MADKEYIERGALIEMLNNKAKTDHEMGLYNHGALTESFIRFVERQPAADVVSKGVYKQVQWERDMAMQQLDEHGIPFGGTADNVVEVEKVAEMLRAMFDDDCACNYNGNDEWLPHVCEYGCTECQDAPEENGCWKQFVKHFLAKMDGGRKDKP